MTRNEEMLELLKDFAEACGMANEGRTVVRLRSWDQTVAWRYEDECRWRWLVDRSETIYSGSDDPICGAR